MKKSSYIMIALFAAAAPSSCDGTKDYEAYVERLKAEEAAIGNISDEAGYAAYVGHFVELTDSFARLDVKFDPTQADEIKQINMRISERMNAKYAELTATHDAPADTVASL